MSSDELMAKDSMLGRSAQRQMGHAPVAWQGVSLVVMFFIAALAVPTEMSFWIGPLRLTAYRLLLVGTAIPCLLAVLGNRAGRTRACDWLMVLFAAWSIIALSVIHDPLKGLQTGGINAVESLGAYVLGRRYIRTPSEFRSMVRFLTIMVIGLGILTVPEAVTGRHFIHEVASIIGTLSFGADDMERRMGLYRAFGPFDHPILYGVFCASMLSLSWFVFTPDDRLRIGRCLRTSLVMISAGMSVSSGAMAAMSVQLGLIVYERLTRRLPRRWFLFTLGLIGVYLAIAMVSNRTPMKVILSYLTFSPESAYGRLVIWDKGTDAVMEHPIFGCGENDWWDHPTWMSSSMDNFWLVLAYMFGLPAAFGFIGCVLYILVKLGRLRITSFMLLQYRRGWMFSLIGMSIAAATVHFWNSLFTYFCFLIGSGVWMLDAGEADIANSNRARRSRAAGSDQTRPSKPDLHRMGQQPLNGFGS